MSDTKPIQMTAEEAALHKEYRRLLMVREDERDHARIAEVIAAINAFHPSLRPLDEEEIDQCIADLKARKRLEQLRDLPRVTAADRERYKQWEQEARAELAEVEPKHAKRERAEWRNDWDRDHAGWNDSWRSLPDYDGPPMRAPSGVEFEQLHNGSLRVEARRTHKKDRGWFLGANEPQGMADPSLVFGGIAHVPTEAEFVASSDRWNDENYYVADRQIFDPPSKGGRGWCPKLAEAV